MRIAISSDNHLDVNHLDPALVQAEQAAWLVDHQVEAYFHVGDLFNDFAQTRDWFAALNQQLAGQVGVYYVAGNHDMLGEIDQADLEELVAPGYLHRRFVDLPGTDWRVIGNNGWYDYSLAQLEATPAEIAQWKRVYWIDASIHQDLSDGARMVRVARQVKAQVTAAEAAGKRVILLTHFVPAAALVPPMPATITKPRLQRFWQMYNAMLGSRVLGDWLVDHPSVERVVYGHLHGHHAPITVGPQTYFNPAVGVKRRHEWQHDQFMDQWTGQMLVWDL